MCELLGMNFNTKVNPHISFMGFRRRGEENPDGWGLAYYTDKSCQIFKEEIKAGDSPLSKFLENYDKIKSEIIIGHVRQSSIGNISRQNTHPFSRELNGKEFVFAHNGTLVDHGGLDTGRFVPIGETDSEHAFCHILNRIHQEGISFWGEEQFAWLALELTRINDRGSFNCIFSDGEHLFCYHDKNGYKQLCLLHRVPPYGKIRLTDDDWEIDLSEQKSAEQTGYVVATRPLTKETWSSFAGGDLKVFKGGRVIYSYLGETVDSTRAFGEVDIAVLRIIRKSPHRLRLGDILSSLSFSEEDIRSSVRLLRDSAFIRQDSRDSVEAMSDDATYYTNQEKRPEIDRLLG